MSLVQRSIRKSILNHMQFKQKSQCVPAVFLEYVSEYMVFKVLMYYADQNFYLNTLQICTVLICSNVFFLYACRQVLRNYNNEYEEFHTSGQYKYQDTCEKILGIVNTYIINNFACVVEFCFRYCTLKKKNMFKKHNTSQTEK